MKKVIKWVGLGVLILLVIAVAGFTIWAYTPLGPMPEALVALQSDAQVDVKTTPWYIFTPTGSAPQTGLIFYPGGRVDPRSYAPAAHALAARGYLVIIPPMPFNLAVFAPNAADGIISEFPQIQHWAIGGHSLGGAMAANYAYKHPDKVQGLALWAAYPASSDNLSTQSTAVTSIFATLDAFSTGPKIDASRPLLPPDTNWVKIEGGNHSQFGYYGLQPGDNPATITRADQQNQAQAATEALLKQISKSQSALPIPDGLLAALTHNLTLTP